MVLDGSILLFFIRKIIIILLVLVLYISFKFESLILSDKCVFIDVSAVWKLQKHLPKSVLLKGILKNLSAKLLKLDHRCPTGS